MKIQNNQTVFLEIDRVELFCWTKWCPKTLGVLFDCHMEFGDGAKPIAIKKNEVIRLVE